MTGRDESGYSATGRLGPMTSEELAERAATVLLVPLGATEQHGPHLPLHTDTVLASVWADAVAKSLTERGLEVVVAPALPYGSSGEHQSFPGTLSIGHEALHLVLVELTRSAAAGFERVVFLSGHAGNLEPVERAVRQLVAEGHDVLHFVPSWPEPTDGLIGTPIDAHAGRTETSLMLHLQPAQVRTDRLAPGDRRPLSETLPILRAGGVSAVSVSGVLGDPTTASADEGVRLLAALVDATVEALISSGDSPRPQ